MLNDKFVVLRNRARSRASDPFTGTRSLPTEALDLSAPEPRIETGALSKRELTDLRRDNEVVSIAPVMPTRLVQPTSSAEVEAASQDAETWGVIATEASESPFNGEGVTVAVLDTGIDAGHAAFTGVNLVQRDFTGEGDGDGQGHGTHVAGTVFGQPLNGLRFGVAPGVDRALIGKVLDSNGSGSTDQIYQAILWAVDQGAHIVSMSLGLDFPGLVQRLTDNGFPADLATSFALEGYRANTRLFDQLAGLIRARAAFGENAILVAAAGNESKRQIDPNYEISVAPPAAADGIVSVGALQTPGEPHNGLTVANFSNTGPNVSAPGVDVISARVGGGLLSLSGTSMATPHVAGIAALWADRMLKATGAVNAQQLVARVVGQARRDRVAENVEAVDLGAGLVRAPLD